MSSDTLSGKASKGCASVENIQGRLRLHLPRELYGGKNKYLTMGLPDTPTNRAIAELRAQQINLDIASGIFDPTSLEKYRPERNLKVVEKVAEPLKRKSLNLLQVWDKYIDFKKASVSPSYLANQLQATRNHLNKLPAYSESDAVAVRDWAVTNL
ncbi:MAG: DUF3596 domain-containing protein, partial [Oscillatoriales cyanobacterium RU_3_3]|nr:DUF3596 domain-containing protein [Oscillatoriales cyanobacterium RU_3_3]